MKSSPSHSRDSRGIEGFVDHVGRLAAKVLAIDGWAALPEGTDGSDLQLSLIVDDESVLTSSVVWYWRKDLPADGRAFFALLRSDAASGARFEIAIGSGKGASSLRPSSAGAISENMTARLEQIRQLTSWKDFAELTRSIFMNCADGGKTDPVYLLNVQSLWKGQMSNVPDTLLRPDLPFAIAIDLALAIDETTIALAGWLRCEGNRVKSFDLVFGDGTRINLSELLVRYERNDVREHFRDNSAVCTAPGFVALIHAPNAALLPYFYCELRTTDGLVGRIEKPVALRDPFETQRMLFASIRPDENTPPTPAVMERYLHPAIEKIHECTGEHAYVRSQENIGTVCQTPQASISVPVYRGTEYVQLQLLQFSFDETLRKHEVIYILDSPEEASAFRRTLIQLAELYQISCRLLVLNRNSGFAVANNLAAKEARGEYLLLLNQDVIPEEPGWLDALISFHKSIPMAGVVGPKLLYEDESIQHGGLYFGRVSGSEYWHNFHYFKGLHASFPGASDSREVPGITAACMLVRRELYEELDGLDEKYIHGDFEDSDFSLRVRQRGLANWYLGSVHLFHLERQSFKDVDTKPWRKVAQKFNIWRQTDIWGEYIQSMNESTGPIL